MIINPEFYPIRKNLVEDFIIAFFEVLWDKDDNLRMKMKLDNL